MTLKRKKQVVIIGCGKMGGSLAAALADFNLWKIIGIDPAVKHLEKVTGYPVEIYPSVSRAPLGDIYIIAVKPQDIEGVLEDIENLSPGRRVLVSIAAGVSIDRIKKIISLMPVVRVMPNTPLVAGEGMSAVAAGEDVPEESVEEIKKIFSLLGEAEVVDESLMDAVTAVSGSGPAYFFLLAAEMRKYLVSRGMEKSAASRFAARTVSGAGVLMRKSGESFEKLMENVTSPGGTTEAALKYMDEKKLTSIFYGALEKAEARSKELSR